MRRQPSGTRPNLPPSPFSSDERQRREKRRKWLRRVLIKRSSHLRQEARADRGSGRIAVDRGAPGGPVALLFQAGSAAAAPVCWPCVCSVPCGSLPARRAPRTTRNPSSWRASVWWCATLTPPRTPRAPRSGSRCARAARRWRSPRSGTPTTNRPR